MNTNLYVITTVFNPFRFKSRARLYKTFAKHMADSGAKLFTVEAAFGNAPFEVTTPDNPMNLQLRTNQVLWHKERMVNLGRAQIKRIFPSAQFLGWFDADITFLSPTWVEDTVHRLSYLSVLQPFSQAISLDSDEEYQWNCPSSLRAFIEARGYHQHPPLPVSLTYKGHPGLAWCITDEVFEKMGGLLDICLGGSADTIMSNAFKGDWTAYLPAPVTPVLQAAIEEWVERAQKAVRGQLGFTPGTVAHHWHGPSESRGYEKRGAICNFHQFDPKTDLVTDESGMLRWAGNKPQLEDDMRLALSRRNEDAPTVKPPAPVAVMPKPEHKKHHPPPEPCYPPDHHHHHHHHHHHYDHEGKTR